MSASPIDEARLELRQRVSWMWMRMGGIRIVGSIALVGCFSGADALGLPCERDEDCGDGQSCIGGVCGGPQTSTSSGSTSEGSTDESTTGIPASCGNGTIETDEGEECDPGVQDNTPSCDANCTLPQCGDNTFNPLHELRAGVFEECDRGPDGAADCDTDCSLVECGDGLTNTAAGEQCDDANGDELDFCTAQCFATLFADDIATDPAVSGKWTLDRPEAVDACKDPPEPYTLSTPGWTWSAGAISSGPQPDDHGGTARMISMPFPIPDDLPAAAVVELRFAHRYVFDICGDAARVDGGILEVEADDGRQVVTETIVPLGGYPGEIVDAAMCLTVLLDNPNPLLELDGCTATPVPAFVDAQPDRTPERASLDAYRGQSVRVIFDMGFDCRDCDMAPTYEGWTIFDAVVAPYCPPTPGCDDGSAICCGDP